MSILEFTPISFHVWREKPGPFKHGSMTLLFWVMINHILMSWRLQGQLAPFHVVVTQVRTSELLVYSNDLPKSDSRPWLEVSRVFG